MQPITLAIWRFLSSFPTALKFCQKILQIAISKLFFFFFRAHEEWGYCQAGTSALITEDQTALIGAPGKLFNSFLIFEKEKYIFRNLF